MHTLAYDLPCARHGQCALHTPRTYLIILESHNNVSLVQLQDPTHATPLQTRPPKAGHFLIGPWLDMQKIKIRNAINFDYFITRLQLVDLK